MLPPRHRHLPACEGLGVAAAPASMCVALCIEVRCVTVPWTTSPSSCCCLPRTENLFRDHNFLFTSTPETPQRLTIGQPRSTKFSDTLICHCWLEFMGQISSSGASGTAQVVTPCESLVSGLYPWRLRGARSQKPPEKSWCPWPFLYSFLCLLADSSWRMCAFRTSA